MHEAVSPNIPLPCYICEFPTADARKPRVCKFCRVRLEKDSFGPRFGWDETPSPSPVVEVGQGAWTEPDLDALEDYMTLPVSLAPLPGTVPYSLVNP